MSQKEYIEVSLEIAPELQESFSSFLIEIGAGGAWIEGAGVKACFSTETTPEEIEKRISPFFLRFREVGIAIPSKTLQIRKKREEDWNREWKKFFKPVRVTSRLTISPPWEKMDDRHPDEKVILIDPGLGFGTGSHPTTRNCLIFLSQILSEHSDPARLKVLDVGSGSGILAMSAARLGAGYVVAAEIDGDALESMRHNLMINDLHRLIRLRLGSIFQADRNSYHLVLANLTAEDLIKMSRDLFGTLLPDGTAILSGILAEKKETVDKEFSGFNLRKVAESIEDKWVTQVWKKVS